MIKLQDRIACRFFLYLFVSIGQGSMYHNRSSDTITTVSLVKSREMLDKLTHKIAQIESNRENNKVIQSIQYSSKKIQHNLDHKIEENFTHILNSPTLMPYSIAKTEIFTQKQNNLANTYSSLEGAKALMYHYWQRNKQNPNENMNKTAISKTFESKKSDNKLPQINSNTDYRLAAFIKVKEKEKEFGIGYKEEQPKEEFHISIKINDFKCQNDSKTFLKFQKTYYKRWDQIDSMVKALEKFAIHYKLTSIVIQTNLIFDLIDRVRQGERMSTHDLLACCENAEKISEDNTKKSGIRFFGKKGLMRALIKIQSHVKRWLASKRYKVMVKQWRSVIKIQRQYRCFLLSKQTKQLIFNRQMDKLAKFEEIQKKFIANYRRKEMTSRVKYEIHIPSHNMSDWQKISVDRYLEKQNSELCRIFKIAESNLLMETKIIYISPINFPPDILNYYKKLLKLGSEQKIDHKLTIITPQFNEKLPSNPSLTQHIYYCHKTIKKIRKLIKDQYAYIVPSTPSNDYIHLCNELNVPLYSSNPQKLLYLSTRAGCKYLQEDLSESKEEGFGILPYSIDIYNESNLLNELTNLIYRYPYVKRWILKIDNETNSRGVAHLDIFKIVPKKILLEARQETNRNQQKLFREEIYSTLENALIINKEERIIPVDKTIYENQNQFLKYYFTRGGIIEASINNFETDLENSCFTVEIEPDGEWKFICSYSKITNKHKAIGSYFDSNLMKPPIQINSIVQKLRQKHHFGYFTLQFLSIPASKQKSMKKIETKMYYLNSIDCHLNQYSAAHYLKNFISKESNALFIPILQHPSIKELRLQTFFHLCRLQNISFDIEKKIGNVFTFVDGLESGCIGIMTFNGRSREDCYAHTAQVLDFLNCKLHHLKNKDIPPSFYSIKNAVNGYLNRTKKKRYQSEKTLKTNVKSVNS